MPKQNRSPNIELLRCALMFLIVLHHCCLLGVFKNAIIGGMSVSTHFAVDAFVFITGWYGVRLSLRKVVGLLGMGLFAFCALGLFSLFCGQGWQASFSLGWFGNSYLALLFVSPLLNAGIDALRREDERALRRAWFAYAVFMFLSWLPIGSCVDLKVAGWFGHSFNTMVFVYVTGRVLSVCEWTRTIRIRGLILAAVGLQGVNLAWGLCRVSWPESSFFRVSGDYDAPFLIALAICVFLIFLRLPLERCVVVSRATCAVAPSMFVVYLLHSGVPSPLPKQWIGNLEHVILPMEGGCGMGIATVLTACVVFVACVAIDGARRLIMWRIKSFNLDK